MCPVLFLPTLFYHRFCLIYLLCISELNQIKIRKPAISERFYSDATSSFTIRLSCIDKDYVFSAPDEILHARCAIPRCPPSRMSIPPVRPAASSAPPKPNHDTRTTTPPHGRAEEGVTRSGADMGGGGGAISGGGRGDEGARRPRMRQARRQGRGV